MAYVKKVWSDRTVERPLTYTMQNNADGTVTLIPAEGSIISAGTPITSDSLNNIENGIATLDTEKAPKNNPKFSGSVELPNSPMIIGTGEGIANYAYLNFMESNGATRKGYVGDANSANSSIYLQSELGSVVLEATSAHKLEFTNVGGLLLDGVHVEARGANSNGEYVKFYGGTQICTHSIFCQAGTGVRTMSGLVYAASFITTPYVFLQHRSLSGKFISMYCLDPTSNNFGIVFNTSQDVSNTIITIVAIGRWKNP